MERQGREIKLLVLLFFQCAFTNGIDLFTGKGSTVTLRCPITFYSTVIWRRHPYFFNGYNFTTFTTITDNFRINPNLPHAKRLRVVVNNITGNFDLQIKNVSSIDEGLYRCIYYTNSTLKQYDVNLHIKTVPEKPMNITIYPALQTVTVTWIRGFNGGYQQEFYVEIRKPTEQRWDRHGPFPETVGIHQLSLLSGLESGSGYLLRMFSRNKLGDSNKTNTITAETRQTQKTTEFLPYILIGLSVIVLVILTNGCTRYMMKRKQHRQQPLNITVNAEPVGVQYGPYDEIGLPGDGYFEIEDPISTNARNSKRDSGDDINQPKNAYLDVTDSASTLASNFLCEPSSISSDNEYRKDNPQEQYLTRDSNYDYAEQQDEDGAYLNPYNSLQGEPQVRCQNYTDIKRSSTTRIVDVYSKGKA